MFSFYLFQKTAYYIAIFSLCETTHLFWHYWLAFWHYAWCLFAKNVDTCDIKHRFSPHYLVVCRLVTTRVVNLSNVPRLLSPHLPFQCHPSVHLIGQTQSSAAGRTYMCYDTSHKDKSAIMNTIWAFKTQFLKFALDDFIRWWGVTCVSVIH